MHEESKEAMDQRSQDKFEDIGKAMVEAVQEEANEGVGQPCPTHRVAERQCISEGVGDVNIPENEVIDHGFLFRLADHMVVEDVLEEQAKVVEQSDLLSHEVVEDEASQVMVHEGWHGESGIESVPFEGPTIDGMLEEQVGWFVQEAMVVEDRLPKVGVLLLMDILLKVSLQVVFHGLQSSRDERYAMEISKTMMVYGADASQVGLQACFVNEAGVWIQVEGRCYVKLHERLIFGLTGAKKWLIMHVLETDGCVQCHVFDLGRVYIKVGRACGFPLITKEWTTANFFLSLSLYHLCSLYISFFSCNPSLPK
ncbi:hypothetical protein GOP47_0022143 [Adiantum capillus-veneris]|uniref:Uncharacterized protein n=1 Tax=Adiantum capillus-veneris TaxID=13818 RepID=A0A9D4Z8I8_ADICA|nr:hypothetical protein GOP47_0022143 [Adiantum capillus-veneris]